MKVMYKPKNTNVVKLKKYLTKKEKEMANEIYDSTWWGNTIDTASSIGTSTEMIQGQFNMNDRQEVEAVKCLADAIHTIGIQDIQN